jgi:hypothetical protein
MPLVFDELAHMVWHVFDGQNLRCIVNLCNKSQILPHKCHPLIKTSSQLLYQVIEHSINAVLLTMTRIIDDTSMVAYELQNCHQRWKSV